MKRAADQTLDLLQSQTATQTLTPLGLLNQFKTGLIYQEISVTGPPHSPVFTLSLEFDGVSFSATGRSKQQAKQNVAVIALRHLAKISRQQANGELPMQNVPVDIDEMDFEAVKHILVSVKKKPKNGEVVPMSKNAVSILNELDKTVAYEFTEERNEKGFPTSFACRVIANGQQFVSKGKSKKSAKLAVAATAMAALYPQIRIGNAAFEVMNPMVEGNLLLDNRLADRISSMIEDKFMELARISETPSTYQVLAGIVLQREEDLEVLAVATGTKVISGECISLAGAAVNDCHAEILAQRCFRDYLYDQLETIQEKGVTEDSILEPSLIPGKFTIRKDCKIHLYINTAPCGDARVFSIEDESVDKNPNRRSRGQLRAKIEVGMGTVLCRVKKDQMWDGIIAGERLFTMSCSDKVAATNVLGVQGALLSHVLDPIYYTSISVGGKFNVSHLVRALYMRYEENLDQLPPSFIVNKPLLGRPSKVVDRDPTAKATSIAYNWTKGREKLEVLNGSTGKTAPAMASGVSRLSKKEFFRRFLAITKKFAATLSPALQDAQYYSDAKSLATSYQQARRALESAFERNDLGFWVHKPEEQDQFAREDL